MILCRIFRIAACIRRLERSQQDTKEIIACLISRGEFKVLSFCKLANMSDAEFNEAIQPMFNGKEFFVDLTRRNIIDNSIGICQVGLRG